MFRSVESQHEHEIELPMLTQEEIETLRQRYRNKTDIFLKSLVLGLYVEGGFYKALEVLPGSCKDMSRDLVLTKLNKIVAQQRHGNVEVWGMVEGLADKRMESPIRGIVKRLSPIGRD